MPDKNGSRVIKCAQSPKHGKKARTHTKKEQKTLKIQTNKTIRKTEIKITLACIRNTNTKLREVYQNLQRLRNNWSARKQNMAQAIQQNIRKRNVRGFWQRLSEQKKPPIRKTKCRSNIVGKVHIEAQNKLRIATEYIRKNSPE